MGDLNNAVDPDVLKTNNLTKQYQMGEVIVTALDSVNFCVKRGEFVAIMGPSGSGKSTLLHLLGGLDTATSGEVVLAGQSLSKLNDDEITRLRRRKIGFIFQFYNLLPTLTALENISLPLLIDNQPITRHRQHINELVDLVGLTDRAHHRPDQLSGGQQQRVAIARAFVNNPEIVLADEPTGNLDSRSGSAILELLSKTWKLTSPATNLNTTIVMVTHDPRAASYASRIVFLKDGKIVHELTDQGQSMVSTSGDYSHPSSDYCHTGLVPSPKSVLDQGQVENPGIAVNTIMEVMSNLEL